MAEYIKREDVLAIIKKSIFDLEYSGENDELQEEIKTIPAADVVEVVRCKDCFNRTKSGMCIQWSRYEKIVNTSDYAFCSWGVKIDG